MKLDIAAIRARAQAATNVPWVANAQRDYVYATHDGPCRVVVPICQVHSEDAAFIATARADVPALCDALEEAEREIERWAENYGKTNALAEAAEARVKELEAQLATARDDALEEAARAVSLFDPGGVRRQIRALKGPVGG